MNPQVPTGLEAQTAEGEVPLRYYGKILQRGWPLLLGLSLAGLVIGGVAALVLPTTYTATTTVFASTITPDPFSSPTRLDGATEAQISESFEVAEAAAATLGVDPTTVQSSATSTFAEDTPVLSVTYVASGADEARAGADAVAAAYLEQRSTEAQDQIARMVEDIEAEEATVRDNLEQATQSLTDAEPGSVAELSAQAARDALVNQLQGLANDRASLQRIDTNGGRILNPAEHNPVIQEPSWKLLVLSGLAGGLLLGLIASFARGAASGRVRNQVDIEAATGLRVLGDVKLDATAHDDAILALREELFSFLSSSDATVGVIDMSSHPDPFLAVALGQALSSSGTPVEVLVTGERPSAVHSMAIETPDSVQISAAGLEQVRAVAPGGGFRIISAATEKGWAAALATNRVSDALVIVAGAGTSIRVLREQTARITDGNPRVIGAVFRAAVPNARVNPSLVQ